MRKRRKKEKYRKIGIQEADQSRCPEVPRKEQFSPSNSSRYSTELASLGAYPIRACSTPAWAPPSRIHRLHFWIIDYRSAKGTGAIPRLGQQPCHDPQEDQGNDIEIVFFIFFQLSLSQSLSGFLSVVVVFTNELQKERFLRQDRGIHILHFLFPSRFPPFLRVRSARMMQERQLFCFYLY